MFGVKILSIKEGNYSLRIICYRVSEFLRLDVGGIPKIPKEVKEE